MAIDYLAESEKYRPMPIETLLIGEAPPPNRKTYFYVPADISSRRPIEDDASLPATIFSHYFERRPVGAEEYRQFLWELKNMGVFLVDIYDEPVKVRGSSEGERKIVEAIPTLHDRLKERGIDMRAQRTIFLLARKNYEKHIRREYPYADRVSWKKFRTAHVQTET